LEVVKKIMVNPDIDSNFKVEFGNHASKFFHEIDIAASVELAKSALANHLGGISYTGDIQ